MKCPERIESPAWQMRAFRYHNLLFISIDKTILDLLHFIILVSISLVYHFTNHQLLLLDGHTFIY